MFDEETEIEKIFFHIHGMHEEEQLPKMIGMDTVEITEKIDSNSLFVYQSVNP